MTARSTTVVHAGRTWLVELPPVTSRHECPRVDGTPADDPEDVRMFAYKLGDRWHSPGYTHPGLAAAFNTAIGALESS
jgi:hypothetical protein